MIIKYRSGGRVVSVTEEEGRALIKAGLADEVNETAPAGNREKAVKNKRCTR